MRAAVTTPVFQPYRGASGRAWMANEYGVTMDNSSLMSSETERDDTDDEIVSFDLGPEPYEPDDHTDYHQTNGSMTISRDYTLVVRSHATTLSTVIRLCLTKNLSWT